MTRERGAKFRAEKIRILDRSEHFPVPPPDPIAAIQFALVQHGMQAADLQGVLGSRQRTHDVLRKKRRLTLPQIRSLNEKLKVPAEILIRDYALIER